MKGCLDSFLKLYRMIIESGMGIQEVMYTVIIANYGLPSVEQRYKILHNKVNDIVFRKQSFSRKMTLCAATSSIIVQSSKKKEWELQESIVKYFRNNDPTYQNIKKSAEDKHDKPISARFLKYLMTFQISVLTTTRREEISKAII